MAETLRTVAGAVLAHCSLAPYLLARRWVQDTYRRACDKGSWSFLRGEGEILTSASRAGTCTAARFSRAVQGNSLIFALTDINRQIRILGNQPPYSISRVDLVSNSCQLDRVFGGTTGAYTATIIDAYVTLPLDFARFIGVLDPSNGYQLRYWITEEELNTFDPGRTGGGTPWLLASRRLIEEVPGFEGQIQYELYPYSSSARNYPYYYIKNSGVVGDDSVFRGPLRDRTDILLYGALANAAGWPGDGEKKNTFFNLQAAERYEAKFQAEIARLEVRDQEIYNTWFETISWISQPFFPVDSRFAQDHDIYQMMLSGPV